VNTTAVLRGRIKEGESLRDDLSMDEIILICNWPKQGLLLAPSCILPRKRGRT
jgi:hypothetical protein